MTAINFPSSPSNAATHAVGDVTYVYSTAKGAWEKPSAAVATIRVLLVGAGGSPGYKNAGAGGGGGVIKQNKDVSIGVTYAISVGVGSAGASDTDDPGIVGGDTSLGTGSTLLLRALGGGGGAGYNQRKGTSRGTGGGDNMGYHHQKLAWDYMDAGSVPIYGDAARQGYAGGMHFEYSGSASNKFGGAGGGAGEVGGNYHKNQSPTTSSAYYVETATNPGNGKGGDGVQDDITGTNTYYGGGGGGGCRDNGRQGNNQAELTINSGHGGLGGGGHRITKRIDQVTPSNTATYWLNESPNSNWSAEEDNGDPSTYGVDGLGGGGGSGSKGTGSYYGGDGGDGIMYIRSATALAPTVVGAATTTVIGSDTLYKWTGAGSITY